MSLCHATVSHTHLLTLCATVACMHGIRSLVHGTACGQLLTTCTHLPAVTPPGHYTTPEGDTVPCPDGSWRTEWKAPAEATSCLSCGTGVLSSKTDRITNYNVSTGLQISIPIQTSADDCCECPGFKVQGLAHKHCKSLVTWETDFPGSFPTLLDPFLLSRPWLPVCVCARAQPASVVACCCFPLSLSLRKQVASESRPCSLPCC